MLYTILTAMVEAESRDMSTLCRFASQTEAVSVIDCGSIEPDTRSTFAKFISANVFNYVRIQCNRLRNREFKYPRMSLIRNREHMHPRILVYLQ